MNLENEKAFFHHINNEIRSLVASYEGKATVTKHKDILGDYATEVDVAVENLIVDQINKLFPDDSILAEEGHSKTEIPDGRIWIIDPICGTTNISRGIKSYCTNIALADSNEVVAACVIDHSQNDYFWSIGKGNVYANDQLVNPRTKDKNLGVVIDVDYGALSKVSDSERKRHADMAYLLSGKLGFMLQSLNSSLGYAYAAIGKTDGFVNVYNHPWDICAASFLVQEAGGVITDLDGNKWHLSSVGAIGANNSALHKELLDAYSAR